MSFLRVSNNNRMCLSREGGQGALLHGVLFDSLRFSDDRLYSMSRFAALNQQSSQSEVSAQSQVGCSQLSMASGHSHISDATRNEVRNNNGNDLEAIAVSAGKYVESELKKLLFI